MLLGYLNFVETDCIFTYRYFYVVFTMRDVYNNTIPYTDFYAYRSAIRASLTLGVVYDVEKCRQYSPEYKDKIECTFEATTVGDDQILIIYQE